MTNIEKFKEVFEETFGYTPEDCFPCPEECPEEFKDRLCKGCPYDRNFPKEEYKEPETKNNSYFSFEAAGISKDIVFALICLFMNTITDDHFPIDNDLTVVRLDLAETFYESWPHSVEYYNRKEKKA